MEFHKRQDEQLVNLHNLIRTWTDIKNDDPSITEDGCNQINSAIGYTNVLINGRLKHFEQMANAQEMGTGEKEIRADDLEALWDLIIVQIEDIETRFAQLQSFRDRKWADLTIEARAPLASISNRQGGAASKHTTGPSRQKASATISKAKLKPIKASGNHLRAHIQKMRQMKMQKGQNSHEETGTLMEGLTEVVVAGRSSSSAPGSETKHSSPLIQMRVSKLAKSSLTPSPATHTRHGKLLAAAASTVTGEKNGVQNEITSKKKLRRKRATELELLGNTGVNGETVEAKGHSYMTRSKQLLSL